MFRKQNVVCPLLATLGFRVFGGQGALALEG